jgi:hypothetical protein
LANLANFHSDLALATKRYFVAHKILYNFYFGIFSSSIQNPRVILCFQKGVNGARGDKLWFLFMAVYRRATIGVADP